MRFTYALSSLFLFGLLLAPVTSNGQSESIVVLSADGLGVGSDLFEAAYGARHLGLAVRYQAGDNMAWADPAFDDRGWEAGVDPWLPKGNLPRQGWSGIGWFRFTMRVDPSLRNRPLGFSIYHPGAVEVYLDGNLAYQSGTVGASRDEEEPYQDVAPFVLPLEAGQEHVLAIRYSSAHLIDTIRARWLGGSGLKIYWGDLATMRHYQRVIRLNEGLYVGFFVAFSVLFGLLFMLYREERLFLYSALWSGCWAFAVLIVSELPFLHESPFLIPVWGIWSALVIGGSFALLRLLYAFFYPTLPRMYYGFLVAGCLTATLVAIRFENEALISVYFIPFFAEVLRIVVLALRRKKRWAWIVGVGFLPIIVLGTLEMFVALGWLSAPWAGTGFEPGMIGVFFLSAALAVYVGMRFAETNRRLAEVNRELIEANQGLDEINRTLEDRVEERTAKLRASQAQLVQAEKMAALGHLASGIAHEIKNPLNFVCNFALINYDLAEEMQEEIESQRGRLGEVADNLEDLLSGITANSTRIAKHGRQADRIVGSMMEHASVSKGERVQVKLNPFVEEYVRIAYASLKSHEPDLNLTIETTFDEAAGSVTISPQEMGKVLMNILKNAFEAVHERVGSDDYEPKISVSTKQTDGHVEICVEDNGRGVSDSHKARIFEPFFTTKPTGRGNAGLGLSLAHDIVVQGHGGSLRVESGEGEGATFIIALPNKSVAGSIAHVRPA